jgi:hypothetical protein
MLPSRSGGIFQFTKIKDIPNENSASKMGHWVPNFILVEDTATIPAGRGIHFGVRLLVVGQAASAIVPLKIVRKFQHTVRIALGTGDVAGYGFDHDFELVPGKWTWEVWSGERKLAEQSFDVIQPQ